MPKMKTHKGLKGRVRVTRNGKLVRRKCGTSHLMSTKNAKRRRSLGRPAGVDNAKLVRTITRALAGG